MILADLIQDESILRVFSILKLFRVLRLSKLIRLMDTTVDIKYSLRIIKEIFFLILYIHVQGCIWIYINNINDGGKKWVPVELKKQGHDYEYFNSLPW